MNKTHQEKCKYFDKLVKKNVYFPWKVVKKSVKAVCPKLDLILLGSKVFEEYKGAFTEQFVLQQLKAMEDVFVHYYTNDDSTLEIDFLLQYGNKILPVEVKAEENLQSKSMKSFLAKNPDLHGLRFSMSPYREQERMTNVPLYAVGRSDFFVWQAECQVFCPAANYIKFAAGFWKRILEKSAHFKSS